MSLDRRPVGSPGAAPGPEGPAARVRSRAAALADQSRRWADRARAGAELARDWAEDARGRQPLLDQAFLVTERDRERLGGLLAGALAYRFFLWLLPFALLFIGTLGAVTQVDSTAVGEASDDVGLRGVLSQVLSDGSRQSGWWIAVSVGIFGTAYAGLGAVRALRVSHAAAWGIRPERTGRTLQASLTLTGVALGLLIAGGVAGWMRERSAVWGLIVTLAMFALYFVMWLRVSVHLPHRPAPVRALVPGALLVAGGAQALNLFTTYYLTARAERASSVYGTIGAALTLLLWLFILARLMVGSAVLNAHLWDRHRQTAGHRPAREGDG